MAGHTRPRFRTPAAALRFYFWASELLTDNATPGAFFRSSARTSFQPPNAICDFRLLDSCFLDMNEAQVWVLKELYGPTCFGKPHRRASDVVEAARRKFPKCRFTPQTVTRFKQEALEVVGERLRRERMM